MQSSSSYHEKDLLFRVSQGDEAAFRELFGTWHQVFAGYILRLTGSRQYSEEILQDVFMKIWMNRKALAEVENFRNYLFIVSRNKAFSFMKKQLSEAKKFSSWAAASSVLYAEGADADVEYVSLLDQAIDRLPPRRKEVYLLSRHNKLTYKEIASRLQISRESVKTHLRLANECITHHLRSGIIQMVILVMLFSRIF